ncbi:MAG: hypothetical protein EOM76_08705 [Sphingobacteriia bacterium]|nr:hypothetical protein [Sphingobacteriia bacterium]
MMDIIIQYLIFKIDMVRDVLILFGACSGVFICVIGMHIELYKHKMVMIILLFIACLFFACGLLLPSSADLLALLEMRI